MTPIERVLYQKKAEFWIRCAKAAEHLWPGDNAHWTDRILYKWLTRISVQLFWKFAAEEVATWRMKVAQEDCKHDKAGVDSMFCPECGKQLGADAESSSQVERIVRKVLSEYDIKPKAKSKGEKEKETPKSLADKLGLGKKKE